MKKLILFGFVALVLVSFTYAAIGSTIGLNAENLTFTGDQNITRFIEVPKSFYITNATFNITENSTINEYLSFYGSRIWNGSTEEWNYTGDNYSLQGSCNYAIRWDGVSSWKSVDSCAQLVYNYYSNWTYMGNFTNLSTEVNVALRDLYTNLTHWVVLNSNGIIFKYWANFTYISQEANIAAKCGGNACFGLDCNSSHCVVVNPTSDKLILYHRNFTFISEHSSASEDGTMNSVRFSTDGSIWASGRSNKRVYKYYPNLTYTGSSAGGVPSDFQRAMGFGQGYWWLIQDSTPEVRRYYSKETNQKTQEVIVTPSSLNNILEENCSCTNCTSTSDSCIVPLIFHSDDEGVIKYSDLILNYSFGLDDCTDNIGIPTNATSHIQFFRDQDDNNVNISYKATLNYGLIATNLSQNFSINAGTIYNISYCIYPNWANLTGDFQIEYTKDSTIYNYFTDNTIFNNVTENLIMYTQNGTTQVLFTVNDLTSDPVENAYIHILKYDVGTGTYKTTEVLRTDTRGQAIGNIVLTTTFYNFYIYYNDVIVGSELGVKVITTTRTFTVNLAGIVWWDNFGTTLGVNTNLYFNNATNNFVYTWTDPTSSMHYGCLKVDKLSGASGNAPV